MLLVCKAALTGSVWLTPRRPRCKNILEFLKMAGVFKNLFKNLVGKYWFYQNTEDWGLKILSFLEFSLSSMDVSMWSSVCRGGNDGPGTPIPL